MYYHASTLTKELLFKWNLPQKGLNMIAVTRQMFPLRLIYFVLYYYILTLIFNSDDNIHPGGDLAPAAVQGTQSNPKVMTSTCPP
jgi:hypothetical protein